MVPGEGDERNTFSKAKLFFLADATTR